ncbi:MAG: hypothetical protein HWE20_12135 [Gammaproteobacteria bacterium]|nr:hypothetical protein [Gammaproteobacteria bacterium]
MHITTTDLKNFTAFGSADYPAYSLYDSLSAVLRERVSPEAASLLARPDYERNSNLVDYSCDAEGGLIPINSLDDESKNFHLANIKSCATEIRGLAETLKSSPDHHSQRLGHMLQQAVAVPDISYIYLLNDKPVVTNWGLQHRDGRSAVDLSSDSIFGEIAEPRVPFVPVEVPPPADVRRFPWYYWLLSALLLLLFALLLWWLFNDQKIGPVVEVGEALVIPVEAIETGNMEFLHGTWRSYAGLTNSRTGEPITSIYVFSKEGKGTKTIIEEVSNEECIAAVTATITEDRQLRVEDLDNARCTRGGRYVKSNITCSVNQSGDADCFMIQESGRNLTVTITRAE